MKHPKPSKAVLAAEIFHICTSCLLKRASFFPANRRFIPVFTVRGMPRVVVHLILFSLSREWLNAAFLRVSECILQMRRALWLLVSLQNFSRWCFFYSAGSLWCRDCTQTGCSCCSLLTLTWLCPWLWPCCWYLRWILHCCYLQISPVMSFMGFVLMINKTFSK